MGEPNSYAFLIFFLVIVLLLNLLITRDVMFWVNSKKARAGLLVLIWALPGLGFFLANKYGHLGWFRRDR